VKVLQLSQNATVATLPAEVQGYVQNAEKEPYGPKPAGAAASEGHGAAPSAGHGTGHE
jgi:hypothetical protein